MSTLLKYHNKDFCSESKNIFYAADGYTYYDNMQNNVFPYIKTTTNNIRLPKNDAEKFTNTNTCTFNRDKNFNCKLDENDKYPCEARMNVTYGQPIPSKDNSTCHAIYTRQDGYSVNSVVSCECNTPNK